MCGDLLVGSGTWAAYTGSWNWWVHGAFNTRHRISDKSQNYHPPPSLGYGSSSCTEESSYGINDLWWLTELVGWLVSAQKSSCRANLRGPVPNALPIMPCPPSMIDLQHSLPRPWLFFPPQLTVHIIGEFLSHTLGARITNKWSRSNAALLGNVGP